jgi:hypothetical protein
MKIFNLLMAKVICQIYVFTVPPLPPPPTPVYDDFALAFPFPAPPVREPEPPRYYLFDGVHITQHAKRQIEKTMMEAPKIKRNRRWSKKPEGWNEKKEEIEKKIEELKMARQNSQDSEGSSTPALSRLLSVGSDKDDDKGWSAIVSLNLYLSSFAFVVLFPRLCVFFCLN